MANETLTLSGRVIDQANRQSTAGLRVEAQRGNSKASTVTDKKGNFTITFDRSHHPALFKSKSPEISFTLKVFKGRKLIKTESVDVHRRASTRSEVELAVDMAELRSGSRALPKSTVKGKVTFANGETLPKSKAVVFDRGLRGETLLGESSIDGSGRYEISYRRARLGPRNKATPDLFVKVIDSAGGVIAVSEVLFNASSDAVIDLTIPAATLTPLPLFERIKSAVDPLLHNLNINHLEEDRQHRDASFLAGKTGLEKRDVVRFILSHKLAAEAIQPEFWFVLLEGSRLDETTSLRDQSDIVLSSLWSMNAAAVRKKLSRGFNLREISDGLREKTDKWVEAFLKFAAARRIAEGATSLNWALDEAKIPDIGKRTKFALLFNKHGDLTPELLDELKNDFSKSELDDLAASFQLAKLTGGDISIVKALKDSFAIREPGAIRALARNSESDWVNLLTANQEAGRIRFGIGTTEIGNAEPLSAAALGKKLERRFREAFPTAAFAGGLSRALNNGGVQGLRHGQALNDFLARHQDFEMLNTPVDEFFANRLDPESASLGGNEEFKRELKAVQRVFKLAPSFDAADSLLAENVHSAQQIYRMGESEFVRRFSDRSGFTAEDTRLTWNRAADTHAAVLTLIGDLKSLDAEGLPSALRTAGLAASSSFPDWDTLFKAGDLCECDHCRSVLGPAAYYADLLMFLRDRKAELGTSVKDLLFSRRPDLGYIELNCENALTPLPYVDVVCEVLESAIDPNDVDLGFSSMPPDAADAKKKVGDAFSDKRIKLGASFALTRVDATKPSDNRWVVHGDDATYLLDKNTGSNFFARVLRNTKEGADELRSYPQYVNPKAYAALESASYPMTLPFSLFAEEVRATFRKSNLRRWDLMRAMHGAAAPNNATDGEIAAEYFGLSVNASLPLDEKRLILIANATPAGQQAVWGETDLAEVNNVRKFLGKTGLEYSQLLELLDLEFINPGGRIVVNHQDDSCDTEKKDIKTPGVDTLDRIHRFLRLWRKLSGWKMWELDLVILHPAIGKALLDELFLINLMHFVEVMDRLGAGVTVEEAAALFGNINIKTHFTEPHEKRSDALYQNLFLNKRLINPIDPAFAIAPGASDLDGGNSIKGHKPPVLSALRIREADLDVFQALAPAGSATPYIQDQLNLANLSFLWRHSRLAGLLRLKPEEWKTVLKLVPQPLPTFTDLAAALDFLEKKYYIRRASLTQADVDKLLPRISHRDLSAFACPKSAFELLEKISQMKASGFSPDELNWVLAADRSAVAAVKEPDAARFLAGLRKELQQIQGEYDPAKYPFLKPPTDVASLTGLLMSLLQKLNRDEAAALFFVSVLRDEAVLERKVEGLDPSFVDFAPDIRKSIRIHYDKKAAKLHFAGLMTDAQRTTLLNDKLVPDAVRGNNAYKDAIEEFFRFPRKALRLFDPVFAAPLNRLDVNFSSLPDPALARRIAYDGENRVLRFAGIMSRADQAALKNLSPAATEYLAAVDSLFAQPLGSFPASRVWMEDSNLKLPLRDLASPDKDNLAANLAAAAAKALQYLSRTQSETAVILQAAVALGLTEGLTRKLFSDYALMPETLLAHFTGSFATSRGAIEYATMKPTFDGWFWANRAAALLKKWKISLEELGRLAALPVNAQFLDLLSLPLDSAKPIAPIEKFLRSSELVRFRDSLPETGASLFAVMERMNGAGYTAASFGIDVELLNPAWPASQVAEIVGALDIAFPGGYMAAESWERLRRAFYFLDMLNASSATVKRFAAATMTPDDAKTLKHLLRARLGDQNWLAFSQEIQDALRERKRDALTAFLLSKPQPADPPSGKWENTNDLYAYYLLDVEMSSCQLTSRLVNASGSVHLLVQRCFMGLEPKVVVNDGGPDGDSAWRWWKWMSKYRVWEANREVFLWPENWIEPELKKDRSSFFKQMQDELLQKDIDQRLAEDAFFHYLEKLDQVAHLEIAGFYQEDDGDNSIIHLFGRSIGGEPHVYYYRTFDYRQWSPWEKVDVDIKGDYLIPSVVRRRLFLFWPLFTEVPDHEGNAKVNVPSPGHADFEMQRPKKKLKLHMAVSEYRNGKWTPKRISNDFQLSASFDAELSKNRYVFFPIDAGEINGRFGVQFALPAEASEPPIGGYFEVTGCKGVPELSKTQLVGHGNWDHSLRPEAASAGKLTKFSKWEELDTRADGADDYEITHFVLLPGEPPNLKRNILSRTPGLFKTAPPWQLSYFDRLWLNARLESDSTMPVGTWLPFFYSDDNRVFFVLPAGGAAGLPVYYPDIKRRIRRAEAELARLAREAVDKETLPAPGTPERKLLEQGLHAQFPAEEPPPYSDSQLKNLKVLEKMRVSDLELSKAAMGEFHNCSFHFRNFYHPFVCEFARLVYDPLQGIPALMSRQTQLKDSGFGFPRYYQPSSIVQGPTGRPNSTLYPQEIVDFSSDGAYSPYNWELFFHAPLMIANQLSKNQRFEEAREWYHFIFNPMGVSSPGPGSPRVSRYWITKPFFETTDDQYIAQRIENILRMLAGDASAPGHSELVNQVLDWRTNPFEPHRIANYRTVAYQKTVVMKYLDNLIAWGDNLFSQDSIESINEATQLYILAAEILGPRPRKVAPATKPPIATFNELEKKLDAFSNALVQVENLVPPLAGSPPAGADASPLPTLYFCIPHNEKLLGYWDTVADRLHKIRHCMNIGGATRQLSLFEPPVDPALLVKAVAAGLDIGSALADLNAPLPFYRFKVMLQEANEVCQDVRALGSALLSALEKRDAETLGSLRQNQEVRLLEAVTEVRTLQTKEARQNRESLNASMILAKEKETYYSKREYRNAYETAVLGLNISSTLIEDGMALGYTIASILTLIPGFSVGGSGFGGSPSATTQTGGPSQGASSALYIQTLEKLARAFDKTASTVGLEGTYRRRQDEWDFQKCLAIKEQAQIQEQIEAADLRVNIVDQELDNHYLQVENAKATDAFMRSKYTNEELYHWQIGQISNVYFQSYKLAYDLAKRVERCFRFELGLPDSNYISFGYWDSLRKGLLSGEKLQYDLRRLEAAYTEQNRREFELTKNVSLLLLDPLALVKLRETGRCFFTLPEEIFDLDYPGHYFRRVKSVSVTLPCVVGPYTTISCTLRLLKNYIRVNTSMPDGYAHARDDRGVWTNDTRFVESNIPVKAIAVSSAQNDSGVFELNFKDERYLPFEGAGAVSEWSLELFNDLPSNNPDPSKPDFGKPLRQFDYDTISDAVIQVKYTAREDAGPFKDAAVSHLRNYFEPAPSGASIPSLRLFNLRQEFPTQWHRFLHPVDPANGNVFEFEISPGLFTLRDARRILKINQIWLLARTSNAGEYTAVFAPPLPSPPPPTSPPATDPNEMKLSPSTAYGGLLLSQKDVSALNIKAPTDPNVNWRLKVKPPSGGRMELEDLLLVLGYEWQPA